MLMTYVSWNTRVFRHPAGTDAETIYSLEKPALSRSNNCQVFLSHHKKTGMKMVVMEVRANGLSALPSRQLRPLNPSHRTV